MANGTEANLKVFLARQQAAFKTGSYLKQSCHISDVNTEPEGKKWKKVASSVETTRRRWINVALLIVTYPNTHESVQLPGWSKLTVLPTTGALRQSLSEKPVYILYWFTQLWLCWCEKSLTSGVEIYLTKISQNKSLRLIPTNKRQAYLH